MPTNEPSAARPRRFCGRLGKGLAGIGFGVLADQLEFPHVRVGLLIRLIEGDVALDLPTGMSALYADLRSTKYRRSFSLSSELETAQIAASLKDGLLTVRIPKRVEFRTRKIKVEVP